MILNGHREFPFFGFLSPFISFLFRLFVLGRLGSLPLGSPSQGALFHRKYRRGAPSDLFFFARCYFLLPLTQNSGTDKFVSTIPRYRAFLKRGERFSSDARSYPLLFPGSVLKLPSLALVLLPSHRPPPFQASPEFPSGIRLLFRGHFF